MELSMNTGYVPVSGGRIYYESGGENLPTIVWMHGLPLNGRCWFAQVKHFTPQFRNVTFDLRGYGRSSKLPDAVTSVTDLYVADLCALFTHLQLDQPTLVAHASGAHGALRFAAKYPDLLGKLVVINGSPRFRVADDWPYGFDAAAVQAFLDVIDVASLDEIASALLDPAMQEPGDPSQFIALKKQFTAMTHQAGKETIKAFFTNISLDDDRELMSAIVAPTLILSSELGKEVPSGVGHYLRKQISNACLVELPQTDHFAFATQPTLVNALIDQFISPRCHVISPPTREPNS